MYMNLLDLELFLASNYLRIFSTRLRYAPSIVEKMKFISIFIGHKFFFITGGV